MKKIETREELDEAVEFLEAQRKRKEISEYEYVKKYDLLHKEFLGRVDDIINVIE